MAKKSTPNDSGVSVAELVREEEQRQRDESELNHANAFNTYLDLIVRDSLTKSEGKALLDSAETLGIDANGVIDDQRLILRAREKTSLFSLLDARLEARNKARRAWQEFLEFAELEATKLDLLLTHTEEEVRKSDQAKVELQQLAEQRPDLFNRMTNPPTLLSPK